MATITVKRNLSTALQQQTESEFTRPYFLARLEFPSDTSYMSSGPQTDFDGNTYLANGFRMDELSWEPGGVQRGTIFLSNENNNASALVLNNTISESPIYVWQAYRDGDVTPELIFRGVLDAPTDITLNEVAITFNTSGSGATLIPNQYHTRSNGFNFLPPAGRVWYWAGEKYELVAEGS